LAHFTQRRIELVFGKPRRRKKSPTPTGLGSQAVRVRPIKTPLYKTWMGLPT